jgi:hypothetical protein
MPRFSQFFSLDSPKAIKAREYGYMNAINYMAPHRLAGVGDLCGNASPGCIALCLGAHSGAATYYPTVLRSRIAKARLLMQDRQAFFREMAAGIKRAERAAARASLKLCVRLNGATDLAWERLAPWIFEANRDFQFVDYTKSVQRMLAFCAGKLPPNYHLTFSASEINLEAQKQVLAAGGNVAVVFAGDRPQTWLGHEVIDGDKHDLRHLDPKGVAIALSPKGHKAKRDKSGFVVR